MEKTAETLLEANGLSCRRGERLVFRDLRFSLRAGEALIVRGANGSGKSSLLRLLAGLLRPEAGTVRYDGSDIADDLQAWRRQFCWLGHQDGLRPAETPAEALRLQGRLRDQNIDPHAALERLGMADKADIPTHQLSAGQKRRVALAGVVASGAPVWLIDEPTTALDGEATALFHALLAAHVAGGGRAVITTHDAFAPMPGFSELALNSPLPAGEADRRAGEGIDYGSPLTLPSPL